MPGKFVLKKNTKGQFHLVLKASNGETIATSETHSSKSGAMNGIASVQKNAAGAKVEDETAK